MSVRPERRRDSAAVEGRDTRQAGQRPSTSLRTNGRVAACATALLLLSCSAAEPEQQGFPEPHRPVAGIVGDSFSTEDARDRMGEFNRVIDLAGVEPGMWVADLGAGEGYYAVRLSPVVGKKGRVLAEDIVPEVRDRLADRVQRENLDNVAVSLGEADDPRLPPKSLDRVFLVHMYHEVESPYAFLWHVRQSLKPGGRIVVVDANRPPSRHGMPPQLLRCEFAAVGLEVQQLEGIGGQNYFASFEATQPRPQPGEIEPCRIKA